LWWQAECLRAEIERKIFYRQTKKEWREDCPLSCLEVRVAEAKRAKM
jgi:hypothetical protein